MGIVFKDKYKLDDAIKAFSKALSLKPNYAEAHYNMGNALKGQGKLEEAIDAYKKPWQSTLIMRKRIIIWVLLFKNKVD